jgi:hypothetical protein
MNTVAVTFAQISFCSEFALLVYACRGRYVAVPWISFLPLLLCHTSYSIKCHRQLKIYHPQTQLQSALNDKMNHSSATQNWTSYTENFSSTASLSVRSRARNWRQTEFYCATICHMKREIPTRNICKQANCFAQNLEGPQCEWPLLYPAFSLKCFVVCIVSTFRKTNGKCRILW